MRIPHVLAVLMFAAAAHVNGFVFTDNFSGGASALWGNEVGNWSVVSGAYSATLPSNSPCTYTSLPYEMTDLSIEFTINDVNDGGVWLHSADNGNGILFVTKNSNFYFHQFTSGNDNGKLAEVDNAFTAGADVSFKITVVGNLYSVYINGSATPAGTFTSSMYSSGKVALYSYSAQSFDNISLSGTVVPEPSESAVIICAGAIGMLALRRRRA
jgi:hypothetical protein